MDTSGGEKTNTEISSDNRSHLTQKFINKVKSVIGFFSMTEEEMLQANINLRRYSVNQNQNEIENLSYTTSSITQDDETIL